MAKPSKQKIKKKKQKNVEAFDVRLEEKVTFISLPVGYTNWLLNIFQTGNCGNGN